MKLLFPVIMGLFFVFAAGCGKSNHNPSSPSEVVSQLQGIWELRHMQMSWWPDSTFAPANGNTIVFTGAEWTMRQGSSEVSGTYTITKFVQSPVPSGACNEIRVEEYPWLLTGKHNSDTVVSAGLRLKGDTLTLRSGCFAVDGGLLKVYVRVHGYL